MRTTTTTTSAATMKVDNYLVRQITVEEVDAMLLASSRTEKLPGSYNVTVHANATVIERSANGDELPFKAVRFLREGHVPATKFLSSALRYLVIDPPEPGVTIDDLNADDVARVRGARS
jgi:hypothetical protein